MRSLKAFGGLMLLVWAASLIGQADLPWTQDTLAEVAPEPELYAAMLLGLGLLSLVFQRKKSS